MLWGPGCRHACRPDAVFACEHVLGGMGNTLNVRYIETLSMDSDAKLTVGYR